MFDIYNDDCIEFMGRMADNSVDMILSDIPYGEVNKTSSGLRNLDKGDANDCDIDLTEMVDQSVRVASGSAYIFCGTEQISDIVKRFTHHGLTTRVCAWHKSNPSPMNGTRLWLSGMEFAVFARKPNATFNRHCETALWKFPSGRSKLHPTEKPVKLIEYIIESSTNECDTVLDFTMGSGTTGVACRNTGRNFIGVELNPTYYLLAMSRLVENG